MASSRKLRKGASRGFETIILKDLKGLQKWNISHLETCNLRQKHVPPKVPDIDHLLCDETLDDLDDSWMTTKMPKEVSKPVRTKLSKTKTPTPTSAAASPGSQWVVPPNSPADAVTASNPYISYLVQSWDGMRGTASASLASTVTRDTQAGTTSAAEASRGPSILTSAQELQENRLAPAVNDILVITDDIREESLFSMQNRQSDTDVHVVPGGGREEEALGSPSQLRSPPANNDFLITPDEFSELFAADGTSGMPRVVNRGCQSSRHSSQSDDEHCVPDMESSSSQQSQSSSQELSSDSFFPEPDLVYLRNQRSCGMDHEVPVFEMEE